METYLMILVYADPYINIYTFTPIYTQLYHLAHAYMDIYIPHAYIFLHKYTSHHIFIASQWKGFT